MFKVNEYFDGTVKSIAFDMAAGPSTIGVMAPSADAALKAMRALEADQSWDPLELIETSDQAGPVFLKANQRVGSIRIRIEHGLGQGILITGHSDDDSQASCTWGPLPLDFF